MLYFVDFSLIIIENVTVDSVMDGIQQDRTGLIHLACTQKFSQN